MADGRRTSTARDDAEIHSERFVESDPDSAFSLVEPKASEVQKKQRPRRAKSRSVPAAGAEPTPIDETDRNEVLAVIREVFSTGEPRDKEQAIRDVARALGYRRVGSTIEDILGTDLFTAVLRGILENDRGQYRLLCRNVEQYTLDHLVEMLLAAIGTDWQWRDEAITAAARHLGYRRTGPRIQKAFKSAINAALRRGLLKRAGPHHIRKAR